MQTFNKKYENIEYTYYEPATGKVYFDISSRLKYISNGDWNKVMRDPLGTEIVKQRGVWGNSEKTFKLIAVNVIDESFTKVESDMKMINYISDNSEQKTFMSSVRIDHAISRLKKVGVELQDYNSKTHRAEDCILEFYN